MAWDSLWRNLYQERLAWRRAYHRYHSSLVVVVVVGAAAAVARKRISPRPRIPTPKETMQQQEQFGERLHSLCLKNSQRSTVSKQQSMFVNALNDVCADDVMNITTSDADESSH
jgi:hypothetical protein